MTIQTDPPPAAGSDYPAVTVCRKVPYNPDEYVRAVFDNFRLEEQPSQQQQEEGTGSEIQQPRTLRTDFPKYLINKQVLQNSRVPPKQDFPTSAEA